MLEQLKGLIKKAKEDVIKGKIHPDEYTGSLLQIYEKMHQFNGTSAEDFIAEVKRL